MIATVVQRGNLISVYDVRGLLLITVPCGTRPGDGLLGYTGSTFTIRHGGYVITYDARGIQLATTPG